MAACTFANQSSSTVWMCRWVVEIDGVVCKLMSMWKFPYHRQRTQISSVTCQQLYPLQFNENSSESENYRIANPVVWNSNFVRHEHHNPCMFACNGSDFFVNNVIDAIRLWSLHFRQTSGSVRPDGGCTSLHLQISAIQNCLGIRITICAYMCIVYDNNAYDTDLCWIILLALWSLLHIYDSVI